MELSKEMHLSSGSCRGTGEGEEERNLVAATLVPPFMGAKTQNNFKHRGHISYLYGTVFPSYWPNYVF